MSAVAASTTATYSADGVSAYEGAYNPLKDTPLRAAPDQKDRFDGARIERFAAEYNSQTEALLIRDRQIEYNVRMVCGQQWSVYHPVLGRFFDVADWLSDEEKAWRQLPVINKLLRYFMVTHGRMTENTPILTMLPGPDRIDAELAQVMDALVKRDWREAGMDEVHDELMMWLIIAGRAHAISRLDTTKGSWRPWLASSPVPILGPDGLPVLNPDGTPAMSDPLDNVPINYDGTPNAEIRNGAYAPGKPHMERGGAVAVDVYSPLQVRGQWGPAPWHKKTWHEVQRFLTPEQVFEWTGVEVAPDLSAQSAANVATLERVLFGTGFYGNLMGRRGDAWTDSRVKGALCTVYQRWQAPIPFNPKLVGTWVEAMMETPDNPGGRETIWTPNAVIYDGPRKVEWPNVSPIRTFDFVRVPGRPSGVTPIESLNGPQRAYNKSRSQNMEHSALLGNPQIIIDENSGIQPSQMTNQPGKIYTATKRPGITAVEYVQAPALGSDVYKAIQYAGEEIDELGNLRGTEGVAPTDTASGRLVHELRINSDRVLGATARRNVTEYARMADDWRVLYKRIYTDKEVIAINGEDGLAQTITVLPMLFEEGHVNITPDAESMLPEGRGERQERVHRLWFEGAFGDPMSDEARERFLEQARFPNYTRMHRPGGIDRVTAEQENGKILSGILDQPVLPWYDHAIHLTIHEKFMKSPEFLKQPQKVQMAFDFHRMQHIFELQREMAAQAEAARAMTPPAGPAGEPSRGPKQIGTPKRNTGDVGVPSGVSPTGAADATKPENAAPQAASRPQG